MMKNKILYIVLFFSTTILNAQNFETDTISGELILGYKIANQNFFNFSCYTIRLSKQDSTKFNFSYDNVFLTKIVHDQKEASLVLKNKKCNFYNNVIIEDCKFPILCLYKDAKVIKLGEFYGYERFKFKALCKKQLIKYNDSLEEEVFGDNCGFYLTKPFVNIVYIYNYLDFKVDNE